MAAKANRDWLFGPRRRGGRVPAMRAKALIGMVHLRALPGSPGSRLDVCRIADLAAAEAKVLVGAGFDGIIIENMHDRPYVHGEHGPEVVAAMTFAAVAVREAVGNSVSIGVQVLSGGNHEAVAIALAAGLQFIRCENFVFAHVADEGLLERAEAGPLLRYRRSIGAEHVRVFADIKKKHASHAITGDVSLTEMAEAAQFFGADGVVVTGRATGKATSADDLASARGATKLPVLVGSGATPETIGELFEHADGVIVGSSIKKDGWWGNPIEQRRCVKIVAAARRAVR